MKIEVLDDLNISHVKGQWLELQSRSDCTFFQSWHWVGSWFANVCMISDSILIRFTVLGEIVGLCILEKNKINRRLLFRLTVNSLNESTRSGMNMCVEYNGPLCAVGFEKEVFHALINLDLVGLDCDELRLSRVSVPFQGAIIEHLQEDRLYLVDTESTWGIDLNSYENGVDGFIKGLKKKRR